MTHASEVYPERKPGGIPIAFDRADPKQEALFQCFKKAFGKRYSCDEYLFAPRRHCLTVLPGGAKGTRR